MRFAFISLVIACGACGQAPAPAAPGLGSADHRQRCERAGGRCIGPAAIAANPGAPCQPGEQRVDDVVIPDEPLQHPSACLGIPFGEEACCFPTSK